MEDILQKKIDFILEVEKLKNIYRQTYVLYEDRTENDSEHSWHLAMMAVLLSEYSNEPVNVLKVVKMVLIHDIVEIDAGDTYCYDSKGYEDKFEREDLAAKRIFGLLPEEQMKEFDSLWREFEAAQTAESKFANSLDRLQPMLLNSRSDGKSWIEHGIHASQVRDRMKKVALGSESLWQYAEKLINGCVEKGLLKE